MPNIKITAEVDGKIVPLNTISTESFEAIKALEKPKEIPIPVARVGNFPGSPDSRRLFLKINSDLKKCIVNEDVKMVAINLRSGNVTKSWKKIQELTFWSGEFYENIKPL